MMHQAGNRVLEARERLADGWNKTVGPLSDHINSSTATAPAPAGSTTSASRIA